MVIDDGVVAEAGALPHEAHSGVALVVAGQPAVVAHVLDPGIDRLADGLRISRRTEGHRCLF